MVFVTHSCIICDQLIDQICLYLKTLVELEDVLQCYFGETNGPFVFVSTKISNWGPPRKAVRRQILQHCFHLIGLWYSLRIQNLAFSSEQELVLLLEFLKELLILDLRPIGEYQVKVYVLSQGKKYPINQERMEKKSSQLINVGRLIQSSLAV